MKNINLQDVVLNQARKEKIQVIFYLTNGFQFRGVIKGFDNFTVLLESEGRQNLVFKHALSTITPTKMINIFDKDIDQDGDEEKDR